MFDFCPHCGQTLDQEQHPGQRITCRHCGQRIGTVSVAAKADGPPPAKQEGERCPQCQQLVEARQSGTARAFVPHFAPGSRKMCPGSGKPIAAPAAASAAPKPRGPAGKDLQAYMTRDQIKVIACAKNANPTIEALTLEYLDKTDRVRLQIDALRDILGDTFRMCDYPAALAKPHLALWGNAALCVVAKRHDKGGYQSLADADITAILADLQNSRGLFFPS